MNDLYDYIIIGGGIAGLYALQELHNKNKKYTILLCDERNYFGGRLFTHKKPHYEVGGARFHDKHKLLLSLMHKYSCHKIPLSKDVLFLEQTKENNIIPYHNVDETLTSIMTKILKNSQKRSNTFLQKYTLAEYINFEYKDTEFTNKIKDIFGYDSEINAMNAYDALRSFQEDFLSKQYYILQEGFSTLCECIYESHKDKEGITFLSKTFVSNIKKERDTYMIKAKSRVFHGKKVIFAIKAPQLRQFSILRPIYPYLSCIYGAPLLRIYAKYPLQNGKVWFHSFPKIITNNTLRQIIPIDSSTGLIMISYTDGNDIAPFFKNKRQKELRDNEEIKAIIAKELKILFPSYTIPRPVYFKTHLWTIGCHHWKAKCDSDKIIPKISYPLPNMYIVGEAFSQKQAWMEGALESVNKILSSKNIYI